MPSKAVFIRASGGKCIDLFYRRIDKPTWSVLCACKPVYADASKRTLRVMNIREILTLQTFPDYFKMPQIIGKEADRVRLIGNAFPPLIAKKTDDADLQINRIALYQTPRFFHYLCPKT